MKQEFEILREKGNNLPKNGEGILDPLTKIKFRGVSTHYRFFWDKADCNCNYSLRVFLEVRKCIGWSKNIFWQYFADIGSLHFEGAPCSQSTSKFPEEIEKLLYRFFKSNCE